LCGWVAPSRQPIEAIRGQRAMESAFRLFSEKGIDLVTMPDISADSGVGRSSFYRYFSTKLDLVIAIGTWKWNEYIDAHDATLTPEKLNALSLAAVASFYEKELASFGLQDVDFVYYPASEGIDDLSKDNMPVVLNGITLAIRKGEYVAFTGQSGCGKSTVLKLLMCVCQPDGGERYYQGETGHRDRLTSAYRRLFAYVPQGNALMSGTIREIVSFAEPESAHNEEKIWQALRIACADGFVKELDAGVDTLLGERGTGLSEGQMQRLAIARAVFSGSPILLLDEATSALDEATEKRLLENLRRLTDKTVITVTHRPAVLSICDRVLHFTENEVKEV